MCVYILYFCLNVCKLYSGPIRLLTDHDFTVFNDQTQPLDGTFKDKLLEQICLHFTQLMDVWGIPPHYFCGT